MQQQKNKTKQNNKPSWLFNGNNRSCSEKYNSHRIHKTKIKELLRVWDITTEIMDQVDNSNI